jgi:glycolate oxidase iron-sulfur subunit
MLLDEVKECSKCGICRSACPIFQELNNEVMSPRGRISLIEAMLEGKLSNSIRFIDTVRTCIRCTRCSGVCPSGVRVENIVQSARELIAENIVLPESVREIFKSKIFNPLAFKASLIEASKSDPDTGKSKVPLWILPLYFHEVARLPELASETVLERYPEFINSGGNKRISLFVGCSINYAHTGIAESAIEVFKSLGVDIFLPEDQLCCGLPSLFMGDKDSARELAMRNIKAMRAKEVDAVVTLCPACGVTFSQEYQRILDEDIGEFTSKLYDISSFIEKFTNFQSAGNQSDMAITYHDPCYLRLGQTVVSEPRKILSSKTRFIEMKDADKCCGLGCTMGIFHPELSMKMSETKINSIVQSGADVVATGCPGCIGFIKERLDEMGIKKDVLHTVQVIHRNI